PSGAQGGSFSVTLPKPSGSGSSGSGSGGGGASSAGNASSATSAPTPNTLPVLTANSGQFGSNPSDLLSDQINLTYQVFNLRMLLERSITDRLLLDPNPTSSSGYTRLQAVIGFDVTLDPPKEAKDSAAIVEVTVTVEPNANPSPKVSLVALMPQEKT